MRKIANMKNVLINVNRNFILMISLFLSLGVTVSCEGETPEPEPDPSTVVAAFSAQVDADNSLTYSFTNTSVVNGITDRTFDSSWDFGGNGTSTEESPTYTFTEEGTYEVKLTVTASDGVMGTATETIEVTAPKNRYAVITDAKSDDTGELRLAVDSIQNGKVTFMYRVAEGPVDMDIQDAFINVTGSSTSGRNSIVEIRLKDNAEHAFREGASDATIASSTFPMGVVNEWVAVEVSWTSDGTNTPLYTVMIGGQTITTDAPSTTRDPNDADQVAEHLASVIDGARNFQWKYASNSNVSDGVYHVDDIVVYNDGTIVFEDDFQGRVKGDDLNPDTNVESPYHGNTSDATVGEDE